MKKYLNKQTNTIEYQIKKPFFGPARTPGLAAQGVSHLSKEGAQGACMNSHAVGPRGKKGGRPLLPTRYIAARCEALMDAIPQTGSPAPRPVDRWPQAIVTPRPKDLRSHDTLQGVHPSSTPALRGLSGLVRWVRPPQAGKTQEADLWRRRPATRSP